MNDQVAISLISAVSGVIIAYIVNVVAKRVQKTKINKQPKDRMEQMFDGYERLIRQKDREDERKARIIDELEVELTATKKLVRSLEKALESSKIELEASREDNQNLREMLNTMRDEYNAQKGEKNVI